MERIKEATLGMLFALLMFVVAAIIVGIIFGSLVMFGIIIDNGNPIQAGLYAIGVLWLGVYTFVV